MSFVNIQEVVYQAEGLLTTKSTGDYVRWEVELFRRRYAQYKKELEEAEAAFHQACKGGTFFTEAEADAHSANLREADTDRSNIRVSISSLVSSAQSSISFAKQQDEWISNDRKSAFEETPQGFCEYSVMHLTLPGSPEEKRNASLLEAEQELKNACEEAKQEAIESGSRRISGSSKEASRIFEERKAAIEEEYYSASI